MKCKWCEIEKNEDDFYKWHKVCKKCRIKKIKEWKKNNPEKVKESTKRKRKENHEKMLERERKYRNENREKINQAATKYRESHRDIVRKRCLELYHKQPWKNKEYRENNPEKQKEYQKKYREKIAVKVRRAEQTREKKVHATLEGKARKAVYMAIKRGDLLRSEKCQMCNLECKTEAHHKDYTCPLEVIWVCKLCHSGIHTTLRRNRRTQTM